VAFTTTTNGSAVLSPDQIAQLVVLPLQSESVAMRASTIVTTGSHNLRVPRIVTDSAASWTPEGQEITPDSPTVDQVVITPLGVKALTIISNELANDSSPSALKLVGESVVRDIAKRIDLAYFANVTSNAPNGLLSIAATACDAGDAYTNLDWAEFAKSNAAQHNTTVDMFVTSPATLLKIATLKELSGSNKSLLGSDPTAPADYTVSGVPIVATPAITTADLIWGIPRSRVVLALRQGTTVETDRSAYSVLTEQL
jgi:HK97 family phage major capsid protein